MSSVAIAASKALVCGRACNHADGFPHREASFDIQTPPFAVSLHRQAMAMPGTNDLLMKPSLLKPAALGQRALLGGRRVLDLQANNLQPFACFGQADLGGSMLGLHIAACSRTIPASLCSLGRAIFFSPSFLSVWIYRDPPARSCLSLLVAIFLLQACAFARFLVVSSSSPLYFPFYQGHGIQPSASLSMHLAPAKRSLEHGRKALQMPACRSCRCSGTKAAITLPSPGLP